MNVASLLLSGLHLAFRSWLEIQEKKTQRNELHKRELHLLFEPAGLAKSRPRLPRLLLHVQSPRLASQAERNLPRRKRVQVSRSAGNDKSFRRGRHLFKPGLPAPAMLPRSAIVEHARQNPARTAVVLRHALVSVLPERRWAVYMHGIMCFLCCWCLRRLGALPPNPPAFKTSINQKDDSFKRTRLLGKKMGVWGATPRSRIKNGLIFIILLCVQLSTMSNMHAEALQKTRESKEYNKR